jgi:pimeloyl-ACP methyl ester carboxylesterase
MEVQNHVQTGTRAVHANGIDIHVVQAGRGEPLILLHGGMVSTNPKWAGVPIAYATYMDVLAQHFHVIAPDTRGCGRTVHPGGAVTFDQLVDDVVALVDVLGLDRPLIAGFSEGALTALILGIRSPGSARAIVSHAGYDMLNPQARSLQMMRQMLGGSPDAVEADPDAPARFFGRSDQMRAILELMKADEDEGQGEGHWKEYLRLAFDRTTRSPGYTFEDLRRIGAPTLILVGDRDDFCPVEEAVTSYRALQDGELAVLPDTDHLITPAGIDATIDFLTRRGASGR